MMAINAMGSIFFFKYWSRFWVRPATKLNRDILGNHIYYLSLNIKSIRFFSVRGFWITASWIICYLWTKRENGFELQKLCARNNVSMRKFMFRFKSIYNVYRETLVFRRVSKEMRCPSHTLRCFEWIARGWKPIRQSQIRKQTKKDKASCTLYGRCFQKLAPYI